jgi:hypothetical protein
MRNTSIRHETIKLGTLSFNKFKINAYSLKKKNKGILMKVKKPSIARVLQEKERNPKIFRKTEKIKKQEIKGNKFSELKELKRRKRKENRKKRNQEQKSRVSNTKDLSQSKYNLNLYRTRISKSKTPKGRQIKIKMKSFGLKTTKIAITPKSTKMVKKAKKRKMKKGNKRLLKAIFQNREIRASICKDDDFEISKEKIKKIDFENFEDIFEILQIKEDEFRSLSKSICLRTPEDLSHMVSHHDCILDASLPQIFFSYPKDDKPDTDLSVLSENISGLVLVYSDVLHFNCHRKSVEILGMKAFDDLTHLLGKIHI